MTLNISNFQKRQITELHMETLLETLDRLHTASYEGTLAEETTLSQEDLLGWLEDVIYTAQETINEIVNSREEEEAQPTINIANLSLIKLRRG
jgi:hypothetical protein